MRNKSQKRKYQTVRADSNCNQHIIERDNKSIPLTQYKTKHKKHIIHDRSVSLDGGLNNIRIIYVSTGNKINLKLNYAS